MSEVGAECLELLTSAHVQNYYIIIRSEGTPYVYLLCLDEPMEGILPKGFRLSDPF